jgi:hypothetical protein
LAFHTFLLVNAVLVDELVDILSPLPALVSLLYLKENKEKNIKEEDRN